MNRTATALIVLLSGLLPASGALARVDPLMVINERRLRSDILILMDTSGSMAWYPNPAYNAGTDCAGDRRGTVDICGDGMCTGAETSSHRSCPSDCRISRNEDSGAGLAPACHPSNVHPSRMVMVKRVLRNLLPDLQHAANFGLVTFRQDGYFRYYRGRTNRSQVVAAFFSHTELLGMNAWDTASSRPRATFEHNGVTYTLVSDSELDAQADSLYALASNPAQETRLAYSGAGMRRSDQQGAWIYRGSYYAYDQAEPRLNKSTRTDTYMGPQFVDNRGRTWVYHRFGYNLGNSGLQWGTTGSVLEPISTAQSDAARQQSLVRIMQRLNGVANGGMAALGNTPTGPAVQTAREHFIERDGGTGPYFRGHGPDPSRACRGRYLLVLTDGQANVGVNPVTAVRQLYETAALSHNPVRTLVVGLPGLPTSALRQLDDMADAGDDGKVNGSASALFAGDEATLQQVITEALLELLRGDYTTTAPGVTSSENADVSGDLALVASVAYPGWRGHLRAVDMTATPPREVWDAGTVLSLTPHHQRRLFTGYPDSAGGLPVPLLDRRGEVNLRGGCDRCGNVGVMDVWNQAGTAPSETQVEQVVQWLAGRGRTWKLGPLVRSSPATVGPPPEYGMPERETFRKLHAARERLIYVTSNDGVLHAFRAVDGSEAFAYVPPNLWPRIHALWQQGGHDPDPTRASWLLAASPRVEDVPTLDGLRWATWLVLPMGPGGKDTVTLDVTDPSACQAGLCVLREAPLRVLAHSRDVRGLSSVSGETWSHPVLFYQRPDKSTLKARMAAGSGYGEGSSGEYYNYFDGLGMLPTSSHHPGAGALVDYGLITDPAVAVDRTAGRRAIAGYQGDLTGRLVRYDQGDAQEGVELTKLGTDHPLYYPPAVLAAGRDGTMLAAVTRARDEAQPVEGGESRLLFTMERDGRLVDASPLDCAVSRVCSRASGCPRDVSAGCTAPPATATPVGPPLLVENGQSGGSFRHEAFYLLFDPPDNACNLGNTWIVRIARDGGAYKVLSTTRYDGVRSTGFSLIGEGADIAVAHIGVRGKPASAFNLVGDLGNRTQGQRPAPYVECWREVHH